MLTITLIGSSASLDYSIFLRFLKMRSCSEFSPLHLPEPQKDGWTDSPQELSRPGTSSKRPLSKERRAGKLEAVVAMMDNCLVKKSGQQGRDMKKLKESVNAIQVGCQICKGPRIDKDCPLNEEVKQVESCPLKEEVKQVEKTDNRPPYSERRQSLKELLAKHQEEYARRSTEIEVWIKKLQENAEINTRNHRASLKNLETQIEQLTKEIHSNKTPNSSSGQIKIVTANQEMSMLNKLHGVSFISETKSDTSDALQHQLPPKELNPGSFTLPCNLIFM
ncbi:hypothetical protein Tco_1268502 [Tanacetum coccineum]